MRSAVVDTGPLVALLNRADPWHGAAVEAFESNKGRLLTTWLVLTEASHLVPDATMRDDLLSMAERGFFELIAIEPSDIATLRHLRSKYGDRDPDLADLSLLVLAERMGIDTVLSFDSDFLVYRTGRGRPLKCPLLA